MYQPFHAYSASNPDNKKDVQVVVQQTFIAGKGITTTNKIQLSPQEARRLLDTLQKMSEIHEF